MTGGSEPAAQDPAGPRFRLPPTIVLLSLILVAAAIAAEFIPPGTFERESRTINTSATTTVEHRVAEGEDAEAVRELFAKRLVAGKPLRDAATGQPLEVVDEGAAVLVPVYETRSRTVVVPGSYSRVDRGEAGFVEAVVRVVASTAQAPIRGFQDKSQIIAFILIIGGSFGLILGTGAVDAALRRSIAALGDDRARLFAIPLVMAMFSLGGAVFGMSEEVIPFVMITIPLAIRLGWDSLTGLCMSFVAAGLGFAGAFINPFTLGIAQGIAEIPVTSGFGFRFVVWMGLTATGIAWTMRWAAKVRRNPELSPTYAMDRELIRKFEAEGAHDEASFTARDAGVVAVLVGAIALILWGVDAHGWYMEELSAVFLGAGVLAAAIGGLRLQRAAECFGRGVADLAGAAVIVAFSAGIVRVLEDAQVLDTMLNAIASGVGGTSSIVAAWLMFLFQSLLNLFVPSGSGQAAMTMPIMAPLSDLVGVTRQTAVLAYQFGDGFTNMIIPTSAVTMSVLGIARVPWETWAKWLLPFEAILFAIGLAVLALAVAVGFS